MRFLHHLLSALAIASAIVLCTDHGLWCQAQNTTQDFLDAHNSARSQVGVPPLVWNLTLATYAQDFADQIKVTCNNTQLSGGPYGENTAAGYGAFTTLDAVSQWVEEKPNYDHSLNSCLNGTECKQYTQVVWRRSKWLGCASILCGAGWPFVVCEYDPPGNVKGEWPY
ncbi:hypothetical protein Nepgr_004902 [Nepenthes gracilis]|uniref:SCP domain-containing protein n=1 Tax=Nepenthes gracilis TaxID=150966 RepID=A0AAD3S255_NEPGR|nr:hypothetical protein Nepgr_004902 [Nepenthes gracilis]